MAALLSLILCAAAPSAAQPLPAPRTAAEARAVLDGLTADESRHEQVAEEMTALLAAVVGALNGGGPGWSAAAVQELAPHDKRHSVLCRRNDLLITGFDTERNLMGPVLAEELAREEWTRLMFWGAGAGLALLVLSALLLNRTRRRALPPTA